jgi:hypothetical protein
MRRLLVALVVALPLSAVLVAQSALRPRLGSRVPLSAAPLIQIHTPTQQPTFESSSTSVTIAGISSDDTLVTGVTYTRTSGTCTAASGTATGTTSWSFGITGTFGTSCAYQVTASDGTLTSSDTITITFTEDSQGNAESPVITITTDGGSGAGVNFATTGTFVTMRGTITDNVGVTLVTWENNPACTTCPTTTGSATIEGGDPSNATFTTTGIALYSGQKGGGESYRVFERAFGVSQATAACSA